MLNNLLYFRSPLKYIRKELIVNIINTKYCCFIQNSLPLICRDISTSGVTLKKRKTAEERALENKGRRVIRYSPKAGNEVVGIWKNMTVQEVADILKKDVDHVYKALAFADKTSGIQYREDTVIYNQQIIRDVAKISGCRTKFVPRPDAEEEKEENRDAVPAPPAPAAALRPRAPVVCVMGHVDHGKTTLLDALRDSDRAAHEFGGITQHIGAFQVCVGGGSGVGAVTFLDTPGHAAFAGMRARGAGGADLVALVVAADDGVMDQTTQSVRMAREAGVPILVVINKIDKPNANIEDTLDELSRAGVVCEARGGSVQAVAVSALRRTNLHGLLEALLLQAEMMELRADPTGPVEGVVLEAQKDARSGKQATVVVQRGTLRRGAVLVAGLAWAKVRGLQSAEGLSLESAGPSTPALVAGWRELPAAGDRVLEVPTEKRAHEVMRWRHAQHMREKQEADMEVIRDKMAAHERAYREHLATKRLLGRLRTRPQGPRPKLIVEDTHPTLNIVLKGDVDGSVEAILGVLDTYEAHDQVRLELAHFGVGPITPNDLEIAETFKGMIYGFNVECGPELEAAARGRGVPVRLHNVIYKLVDDLKAEINGRIPLAQVEEIIGEASVLQEFEVSEGRKKVPVAGCRCVRGALHRHALYRVTRAGAGEVVYEGKLASMKHLKEEVGTIKRDVECGLRFEDPSFRPQPGDTVVCYKMVDVAQTTRWDPGF